MVHLLFFDFGTGEILIIVLAVFLVFGPGKIPELARNLGKFVNEIKKASEEVRNEINREADRQERKEKLKKYQEQVNNDLKNDAESNSETTPSAATTEDKATVSDQETDAKQEQTPVQDSEEENAKSSLKDDSPEPHEQVTNKPDSKTEKK